MAARAARLHRQHPQQLQTSGALGGFESVDHLAGGGAGAQLPGVSHVSQRKGTRAKTHAQVWLDELCASIKATVNGGKHKDGLRELSASIMVIANSGKHKAWLDELSTSILCVLNGGKHKAWLDELCASIINILNDRQHKAWLDELCASIINILNDRQHKAWLDELCASIINILNDRQHKAWLDELCASIINILNDRQHKAWLDELCASIINILNGGKHAQLLLALLEAILALTRVPLPLQTSRCLPSPCCLPRRPPEAQDNSGGCTPSSPPCGACNHAAQHTAAGHQASPRHQKCAPTPAVALALQTSRR